MELFNKKIDEISYEYLCEKTKYLPEGYQIDYKHDVPKNGLSKYFTSFSNTVGGILLLGVKTNKETGLPESYDGIKETDELHERILQYVNNISPVPLTKPQYNQHFRLNWNYEKIFK